MDSIEKMKSLLDDLSTSGTKLPNLDTDSVIKNIVKSQYGPLMDQFPNKKDAESFIQEMENYIQKNGKEDISIEIAKIKSNFKQVKDSIPQLKQGIIAMTTSIALPPSIPGVQNPIFSFNEALSKFNTIKSILNQANTAVSDMIGSAIKIKYPLPDSALSLIEGLSILNRLLTLDFKKKIDEAETASQNPIATQQTSTQGSGGGTNRPLSTGQTSNVVTSPNRPRKRNG